MTVESIPILANGSVIELQDWLDTHTTVQVKEIKLGIGFWYVFYE